MGVGMYNIYNTRHWQDQDTPVIEHQDRIHKANDQVDTTSPWFSPARFSAHRTAAPQGQQAFDTAYNQTASTWYGSLSDPMKQALRKAYL